MPLRQVIDIKMFIKLFEKKLIIFIYKEDSLKKMIDDLKMFDPKLEFIAMYLFKSFKIKSDKWVKMFTLEENRVLIEDFMNKEKPNIIVFSLNSLGSLVIQCEFPNQIKSKIVYFCKKITEPLGKNGDIINQITYGDLSQSPVEQLYSILDGVNLCLLIRM